jgi:hypothetical protein
MDILANVLPRIHLIPNTAGLLEIPYELTQVTKMGKNQCVSKNMESEMDLEIDNEVHAVHQYMHDLK